MKTRTYNMSEREYIEQVVLADYNDQTRQKHSRKEYKLVTRGNAAVESVYQVWNSIFD